MSKEISVYDISKNEDENFEQEHEIEVNDFDRLNTGTYIYFGGILATGASWG